MKTLLKAVAWLIGIYLLLMLGAGLAAKMLLSGDRIRGVLASMGSQLPTKVSASGGDFDLVQWFQFQPAITIRDLSIANPPGFSTQPMLRAGEVSAQVALLALLQGDADVRSFTLRNPELNIETNRNGQTNLQALLGALEGGAAKGKASGGPSSKSASSQAAALSVDAFSLQSGTIRFTDQGQREPVLTVRDIDVDLADFGMDRSCRLKLGARLFGGKVSRLDFTGRGGPFRSESAPVEGTLSLKLAPVEVPAALRVEYLGDMLRDPGDASRAAFEATMRGDLMKRLEGTGKLALDSFQLGKDRASRIPLRGDTPLRLSVERALANPAFAIEMQNASLQLGAGRWKGAANARFDGTRLQGGSKGAITGVQIDQMLTAFTSARGKVSGIAEIPEYSISFGGRNAGEIRNSLNGQGSLTLEKGSFAMFNLLNTIEQFARKVSTSDTPSSGSTDFTTFKSSFRIANRQVQMPDPVLENAAARITGQGYFTFEEQLNFDLVSNVGGGLASLIGGRPDSSGRPQAAVPVRIRGTLNAPKVYPDVGKIAVQTVTEKATGILNQFLSRKKTTQ